MLRFLSPYRLLFFFFNMTVDLRVILSNWSYPFALPWLDNEEGDMQPTDIHSTISAYYKSMCLFRAVSLKVCQWCQCQQVNQSGI